MSLTTRLSLLAGAAMIGLPSGAMAEMTRDEVRATVAEMMADAETRSSLLQSGGTAGHDDGGFFLGSSDGNFRLNVGGQIQFRYYLNFRDDNAGVDRNGDGVINGDDAEDDFESGFQTRRTKLIFDGHIFDPNLFYKIQTAFDFDGDGSADLEDAFVGYKWESGFQVRWGQFKSPFLREELVDDLMQLAADRGLVNSVFTGDRTQGVELGYNAEDFRVMVAFTDGFRTLNSDFDSPRTATATGFLNGGESDYAFTGRGEIKLAGSWDQFQDFTSASGSEFGVLLGVAGHVEGGDNEQSAIFGGQYNYYSWTADISFEGDGWNAFIAGVGGHSDYNNTTLPGAAAGEDIQFNDYGLVGQFGIMIPNTDWEPFVRYDGIFPDTDERNLGSDEDIFSVITGGVNYYMYGHASRFTADVLWFIDGVGSNALANTPDSSIGYLTDDDDNEITIRFQWQIMF